MTRKLTRKILAIAALVGAVACTSVASTGQASAQSGVAQQVRCDVRAHRMGDNVRLEAIARADAPAYGEYEFIITKRDGGGSSDIVQGGAFSVAPGRTEVLGAAEFSLERRGDYRVRLTLRDHDGIVCGYRTPA